MKKVISFIFVLVIAILYGVWFFLGPVGGDRETVFIVPTSKEQFDPIDSLTKTRSIKHTAVFAFFKHASLLHQNLEPGGYRLSSSLWAWDVLKKVNGKPDMIWVTIGGCLRKEQIGEILMHYLDWNEAQLKEWNSLYAMNKPEYYEGVYYPDTYLIPRDEEVKKVAARMINRFNEQFAPLADAYMAANIRWVTGIKIASLIAREAAGTADMHLISGIIWNRLTIGMPLQIDATMQYTLGKNEQGKWWGSIDIKEKQKDSPYNSYRYKGLPPTPICSPNIAYIEAALNPAETDCLFYLHDRDQQIHCAKTYEDHLINIRTYLD